MKQYVAGFAMTDRVVLLVKKDHPPQLAGRWNAVGGKVDEWESSYTAMIREFMEETGVFLATWSSRPFCRLLGNYALNLDNKPEEFVVDFFYSKVTEGLMEQLARLTRNDVGEQLAVWPIDLLPDVLPNVTWLVPMARSFALGERASGFTVEEAYAQDQGRKTSAAVSLG